jgi:hypothetical protein
MSDFLALAFRRVRNTSWLGAVALVLAGCGHVPLTSLPRLMQIDFKTTNLADLRATILIPEEIRPLPGAAQLTIKVKGGGSNHERRAVLEEVVDQSDRAGLPKPVPAGMRLITYRLAPTEAARLSAFRSEVLAEMQGQGSMRRDLTLGVGVDKFCNSAPLRDGPVFMTSYLRTSETREHVVLTHAIDLKKLAAEEKVDTAKMLTPCKV